MPRPCPNCTVGVAVAPIQRPVAFRLSATPDQRTFVYSRPVTGADLMLIDNFR